MNLFVLVWGLGWVLGFGFWGLVLGVWFLGLVFAVWFLRFGLVCLSKLCFCFTVENVAYHKLVNHSGARSDSRTLVDGDDETCITIEKVCHSISLMFNLHCP